MKEIFERIFNVDLSKFEDKKKEDIAFEFNDKIFIGEIKGVNQNIKTSNLSQLDNHFTHFVDNHGYTENEQCNIYKLLIMNHQKNKPMSERDPVDIQQIQQAENKYQLLIIETIELLKMYDKFTKNELTTRDCYDLICKNGLLKI